MDRPIRYEICVDRHLGPAIAALFPEWTLRNEADGSTLLSAELPDQAARHGARARLRDLGVTLLVVGAVKE